MESARQGVLVFLGAGLGANGRYWLGIWMASRMGTSFPWATFAINLSGSFLIGLFMGLSTASKWDSGYTLLVAVGLLGGYTTFSSFSFETLKLLQTRSYLLAGAYSLGSLIAGLVCCWAGVALARALHGGAA